MGRRPRGLWRFRTSAPCAESPRVGKGAFCTLGVVRNGVGLYSGGAASLPGGCLCLWDIVPGLVVAVAVAVAGQAPEPLPLLLTALPGAGRWAQPWMCSSEQGALPVTGSIEKPSEEKITCTDFERKQLVVQYIGTWQEIKLLP